MSLLDDENAIIENVDKRLELEKQVMEIMQKLFDSFNMSTEKNRILPNG